MGSYLGRYIASWVGSGYLRGVGGHNNYQQPLPPPTHTQTQPSLGPTNVIQMRTRNSSFVDFYFFLVSFGGCETARVRGPTYVLGNEDKEEFVREFVDYKIFLVSFRLWGTHSV